jgi:hypothetical protein
LGFKQFPRGHEVLRLNPNLSGNSIHPNLRLERPHIAGLRCSAMSRGLKLDR